MSSVKIAIVGTGLIGPRHAQAVLQDPEAELACIVDPNPAAESIANELGTTLYASIQDMLASSHRIDAAIVCTPNHTHVAVSKELLDGGVHVLVEKPISVDVGSGSELVGFTCVNCSPNTCIVFSHEMSPWSCDRVLQLTSPLRSNTQ
jgi:predicted dehydrogenase